jgi:hypothetical protein
VGPGASISSVSTAAANARAAYAAASSDLVSGYSGIGQAQIGIIDDASAGGVSANADFTCAVSGPATRSTIASSSALAYAC